MSPIRVKLGDFGISKQIQPQATTALHTQVSTRIYAAPEVLGLDSNCETSVYTNSVDIWSLGCVMYELLVGIRLFASETQVSLYFFGKLPFPEDELKGLSPPTDGAGISLLKSMLAIQPEDRPTAAGALANEWLLSLQSGDEDDGEDQDETMQRGYERSGSGESEVKPTTLDELKKRSQRNPTTKGDSKNSSENIPSGVGPKPQVFSDPTAPESETDTAITILPDAASAKRSLVPKRSIKLESQGGSFRGPQGAGSEADPQYFTKVPLE